MSEKYNLDYLEKEIEKLEQAGKLPKSSLNAERVQTESVKRRTASTSRQKENLSERKVATSAKSSSEASSERKASTGAGRNLEVPSGRKATPGVGRNSEVPSGRKVTTGMRSNDDIPSEKKQSVAGLKSGAPIKAQRKKKLPIYWICLGIYALILIILGGCFLRYVNNCLVKYENSQSDNAMVSILEEFKGKINDNSITAEIEIPGGGEFEAADVFSNMYLTQLKGVKEFTYEKDSGSYLTESPIYDIYGDGELVAKLTLTPTNEQVILKILTIMDWEIDKISPVLTAGTHNYTITIPSDCTATVNGIALTNDYLTGEVAPEGFENVSDYVEIPSELTYTITGLVNAPEVIVLNSKGESVDYEMDADGNVSYETAYSVGEISDERKELAYEIAKTWEDFLTNDLSGDYHGLPTIQQYLIKDSYYWDQATAYAKGADIGLMADHTLDSPAYSDLVVDNYIEYTENCFSCHISFNKNMLLTRAGNKKSTDTIDSVFYFVYYDDTDDGEDNPHWGMVDMITEE
jgi:hypothetical protein